MITMRKNSFIPFVIALVAILGAWLAGCDEEKKYDIVIGSDICPDTVFTQDSASEIFTDTVYVEAGEDIDDALKKNGYSRSSIKAAILNGAYYTVTEWVQPSPPQTDWKISGAITIQRTDVPGPEDTLVVYDHASVKGALGNNVTAKLDPGGVDIVNQALEDFLDGADPAFRLVVLNGDCDPNPSLSNRIQFKWYACLQAQIVLEETSKVFDPL
jgi:hypothetical protein